MNHTLSTTRTKREGKDRPTRLLDPHRTWWFLVLQTRSWRNRPPRETSKQKVPGKKTVLSGKGPGKQQLRKENNLQTVTIQCFPKPRKKASALLHTCSEESLECLPCHLFHWYSLREGHVAGWDFHSQGTVRRLLSNGVSGPTREPRLPFPLRCKESSFPLLSV